MCYSFPLILIRNTRKIAYHGLWRGPQTVSSLHYQFCNQARKHSQAMGTHGGCSLFLLLKIINMTLVLLLLIVSPQLFNFNVSHYYNRTCEMNHVCFTRSITSKAKQLLVPFSDHLRLFMLYSSILNQRMSTKIN